jgi:hypothetical protein
MKSLISWQKEFWGQVYLVVEFKMPTALTARPQHRNTFISQPLFCLLDLSLELNLCGKPQPQHFRIA